MSYFVVIPARYASSRLPAKPLIPICGIPMIVRTYRQCLKAVAAEQIYVATDDHRIADTCREFGIRVALTSPECLTGTDRVAEFAKQFYADTYVNVQGDEPLFNPDDLRLLIQRAEASPHDIINGYCQINDEADFRNRSIPKVIVRPDESLLYMSRAPIPLTKSGEFVSANRQVCAYSFPRKALEAFSSIKTKTPLEEIEDIEILRFLELGFDIKMIRMSDKSVAVDNPCDIEKVERIIRNVDPSRRSIN